MENLVSLIVAGLFVAGIILCLIPIFRSLKLEKLYRNILTQDVPYSSISSSEPFPGALFLSALLVFVYDSESEAEKKMRMAFNKIYHTDWGSYCRAADSLHSELNGDLLVERLAAVLKKESMSADFLSLVFNILRAGEMVWANKNSGKKPSEYLARLLNYTLENSEIANAYKKLGLEKGASFDDVKSAHRKLAAKYHPDRIAAEFGSVSKEQQEKFEDIQKAYEFICQAEGK